MLDYFLKSRNFFQIIATFLIGILILFVSIFLKYAFRRHFYNRHIPSTHPGFFDIFGDIRVLYDIKNEFPNINAAFIKLAEIYDNIFKKDKLFCFWLTYVPLIVIRNAESLEGLITSNKTSQKAWFYNFLHPWLGTGLLTSHGMKWKSRRKLLTPSFHFEILKDFLPVFNEQSQKLVKILQKETSKEYIDIAKPITLCSLDIICESTLGVCIGVQENQESEYVKAVIRTSNMIIERMVIIQYWFDFIFRFTAAGRQHKKDIKLLHDFTLSVIREKKQKLLSGDSHALEKKKRKALMDVLLEHHIQTKDMTEEDIREEVDTFAFEGHDTTSMGMTWALYLIGLNKDVQGKIQEELDRIFEDDTERPVTSDDLKDMTYLDYVLKESQRLYPSVPFIGRENDEDITICGYTIPKGSQFVIMTYYIHRDGEMFPDPEKFDPDRFLPENSANRHPYAYVPFSAGPRNCIGQRFAVLEEKVVVANILRNFTLESLNSREKQTPAVELILRPCHSVKVKISPRQRP